MPDDPIKRGKQDRSRVSQQEHEQRYQKEKRQKAGLKVSGAASGTKKTGSGQRRTG